MKTLDQAVMPVVQGVCGGVESVCRDNLAVGIVGGFAWGDCRQINGAWAKSDFDEGFVRAIQREDGRIVANHASVEDDAGLNDEYPRVGVAVSEYRPNLGLGQFQNGADECAIDGAAEVGDGWFLDKGSVAGTQIVMRVPPKSEERPDRNLPFQPVGIVGEPVDSITGFGKPEF